MSPADYARILLFVPFGVGLGFMLMTNIIAYKVLRPPQKLGFLWWHVTSISLSFMMIGVVALEASSSRLGEDLTWRLPVTLTGTTLFAVAQVIIFNVERQRLVAKKAQEVLEARHDRG